jgi:transcriptional regulator GlxA family with amidase domain
LVLYLAPQTRHGVALNALSGSNGQRSGIWIVEDGEQLADAIATVFAAGGPRAASDVLIAQLCRTGNSRSDQQPSSVHPQLAQAIELVSRRAPADIGLRSIARAVALSPDYLGRLCKQQTGASFSAATRWARLQAGLRCIADGMAVTDAAHQAGFADGSHANRVCWEMTGAAPSNFARALQDPQLASPRAG